jgi:probable HAF family extracellular repeat protein
MTLLLGVIVSVATSSAFAQTYSYSVIDLGTLPNGVSSFARNINNVGQVVGEAVTADGRLHAFLYSNGVMTDLGTAGGYSIAYGINDLGQITGVMELPSTAQHTFLYSNGSMNDLGTLPGTDNIKFTNDQCADRNQSVGFAVNNATTIVGTSKCQAMIYSNGKMTGLNQKGAYYAMGINNVNQIVGMSQYVNGGTQINHAFLYHDGNRCVTNGRWDDARLPLREWGDVQPRDIGWTGRKRCDRHQQSRGDCWRPGYSAVHLQKRRNDRPNDFGSPGNPTLLRRRYQ